ncbi:MAG: hypothetical protein RTU09_06355 [Candidatus Thorarchaeota archaeon]
MRYSNSVCKEEFEVQRIAKCPVCSEKAPLDIDYSVIKTAKRFPVTVKVEHDDHYFYVNLDSVGSVTDILHPDLVE